LKNSHPFSHPFYDNRVILCHTFVQKNGKKRLDLCRLYQEKQRKHLILSGVLLFGGA
jgi:hypothetical protein